MCAIVFACGLGEGLGCMVSVLLCDFSLYVHKVSRVRAFRARILLVSLGFRNGIACSEGCRRWSRSGNLSTLASLASAFSIVLIQTKGLGQIKPL